MPLCERLTRLFHQALFGAQVDTVILYKRGDDQEEGEVSSFKLFRCWGGAEATKSGQPILRDMAVSHSRQLNVPKTELERYGIDHLNVLDRFKDKRGWVWQPETNQLFRFQLFENYIAIECVRIE